MNKPLSPISRQDAFSSGKKRFYTGRPCAHGHDSERFVSTGGCVKCNAVRSKIFTKTSGETSAARLQNHFIYPLHPADHAAALAFCQGLDMMRSRVPFIPTPTALTASATPADVEAARRRALGAAAEMSAKSSQPEATDANEWR